MALIVSNDGVYITLIDLVIMPISYTMLFSTTIVAPYPPLTKVQIPAAIFHMERIWPETHNMHLRNRYSVHAPYFNWKIRDYMRYRSYIDHAPTTANVILLPDDLQMAVDSVLSDIY